VHARSVAPENPADPSAARVRLVGRLQLAYSGELAAGLAYRGHSRAVRDPGEKERIQTIEAEEWHHRRLVGEMLAGLGSEPLRWREVRAFLVGHALSLLCHVAGWFAPMYGAGRLESRNVKEYEDAALCAIDSGHPELIECLLQMAEVEWEHERYFRSKVLGNPWTRLFPVWAALPPKESIRQYSSRSSSPAATHSAGDI
jgi:rubrerythrin